MSTRRSRVPRQRLGTPVSSVRMLIAQRVLDQLEPLHDDDPKIDQALKEANARAVSETKRALEKWVRDE